MTDINLAAIRARDADYNDVFEAQASMSKDIAHRLVAWPVADRRALLAYVDELRSRLAEARCVCDEQATDAGLWFVAEMVTEAYLQAALRRLHAAVEGTADSASNREDERV